MIADELNSRLTKSSTKPSSNWRKLEPRNPTKCNPTKRLPLDEGAVYLPLVLYGCFSNGRMVVHDFYKLLLHVGRRMLKPALDPVEYKPEQGMDRINRQQLFVDIRSREDEL